MTKFIKKLAKKNKAFTLFVSLLVSAFLLAIGFSLGNILIKQLTLSSSGGGTQVAFYAADSAAECALYWDRKDGEGLSVSDSPFGTTTIDGLRIVCGSGVDTDGEGLVYGFKKVCDEGLCGAAAVIATSTFYVSTTDPNDPKAMSCAFVTVVKKFTPATGVEETSIDSRGYNTDILVGTAYGTYALNYENPDAQCNLSRPKTVERGIFLSY